MYIYISILALFYRKKKYVIQTSMYIQFLQSIHKELEDPNKKTTSRSAHLLDLPVALSVTSNVSFTYLSYPAEHWSLHIDYILFFLPRTCFWRENRPQKVLYKWIRFKFPPFQGSLSSLQLRFTPQHFLILLLFSSAFPYSYIYIF